MFVMYIFPPLGRFFLKKYHLVLFQLSDKSHVFSRLFYDYNHKSMTWFARNFIKNFIKI